MTLSNENKEVESIKKYINNTIENDEINFNHVFSIDKKEFAKFLKNSNKKSEFTFELTEEGGFISGVCSILKNGKVIDNVFNPAKCLTDLANPKYTNVKNLLRLIFQMNFNFENVNINLHSLEVDLKYIAAIYNSIKNFNKNNVILKIAKDEENNITSILAEIKNRNNYASFQIIIAKCIMPEWNYNKDEDIISTVRKEINKNNLLKSKAMETKSKTIIEWFNELPEPFKSQAIANTSKNMLNEVAYDILAALSYAFTWSKTPEGIYYWKNLYYDMELKINNPEKYKLKKTAERLIDLADLANNYLLKKLTDNEFKDLLNEFIYELK